MAVRKRTIQPSIWQDTDFGTLSPMAQLIFIGCITQADDEGRLNGHPVVLASTLFPYRTVELEQVLDALDELSKKMRNMIFYRIHDEVSIQLLNWEKHQIMRDDRKQKSLFPPPPKDLLKLVDGQMTDKWQAGDGQVTAEEKGREVSKGKGREVPEGKGSSDGKYPQWTAMNDLLTRMREDLAAKGIIKPKEARLEI